MFARVIANTQRENLCDIYWWEGENMSLSPFVFWSTDFEIIYYSFAASAVAAAAVVAVDFDFDCGSSLFVSLLYNIQSPTLVRTYER